MGDDGRATRNRHLAEVAFLVAVPLVAAAAGAGGAWMLGSILGAWLVVGLVELRIVRARRAELGAERRPLPRDTRRFQLGAMVFWGIALVFLVLALAVDRRFFWPWIAIWAVGIAFQLRASRSAREALQAGRRKG